MASGSAANNVPQVNGKRHSLNPEAREFTPSFMINNSNQHHVTAAMTTTAVPPPPTIYYNPYRCPKIVPVVYPSVYGTPGTVFFMPIYQVPYSAIPLPMKNGNGDFAYFYRVKHY